METLRVTRTSSMSIISTLLDLTGDGSEITVFSYSITDVWMRRIINMRAAGKISRVVMVLDRDVMIRHREKLNQLQFAADEVYLTDTHAKIYLCKNNGITAAAVTSANATNNLRHECFYITDGQPTKQLEDDIRGILAESYRII